MSIDVCSVGLTWVQNGFSAPSVVNAVARITRKQLVEDLRGEESDVSREREGLAGVGEGQ